MLRAGPVVATGTIAVPPSAKAGDHRLPAGAGLYRIDGDPRVPVVIRRVAPARTPDHSTTEVAAAAVRAAPTTTSGAQATRVSELQELVDSLAVRLGRAVAIDDHQFHLAVFSSHAQDVDEVRLASILRREAPDEVQRWLLDLGIDQATEPVHLPANERLGMRARWCVPIRFEGLLFGYLWLVEEPTGPNDNEIGLAERCAAEIAPLLYRERMLDDAGRRRERALVDRLLRRRG